MRQHVNILKAGLFFTQKIYLFLPANSKYFHHQVNIMQTLAKFQLQSYGPLDKISETMDESVKY